MATNQDPDAITGAPAPGSSPPPAQEPRGREKAAQFLANAGEDTSYTYEEEKSVLRRVDLRVLPIVLFAYFFQQLDKSSLSYVSVFGIVEDAKLVNQEYSWLGSILYLAQLVMQPLAAYLLVKLPTGKLLASAIVLWGSSLTIMAACTDFKSLLGLRFCLGAFESMIAPCCVAITQMWWRRSEQTMRTSFWNAMNGLTSVIGSLFTYGLGKIESDKLFKYQIIFLFCGLLTVAYGILVFFIMPDSPMEAKFLGQKEKVVAVERLRANQMGIISREWRWDHVKETFLDIKTYCWFFLIVAISIPSGGISSFGNLIVKSFGYDQFTTILFNIPFGAIQVVAIIAAGWLATKIKSKAWTIFIFSIPAVVGTIIMLAVPRQYKGVLLLGYYLVSFLAAITPMVYAWEAQNTAGDTKRKCTSAIVFVGMCTGNVIGPQLYSTSQAPTYRPGLISNLIMFIITGVIALLVMLYLMFLNRRHAQQREQLGKSAVVVDESMMNKAKVRVGKEAAVEMDDNERGPGTNEALTQDKGFSDVTDLQNEDFIYVY